MKLFLLLLLSIFSLLSADTLSLVKNINTTTASAFDTVDTSQNLVEYHGEICYFANDGTHENQLYCTQTSDNTTRLVKNFDGTENSADMPLVIFDDNIYFVADDSTYTSTLWKSNATTSGTVKVDTNIEYPGSLTVSGSHLFFASYDKLYVYDGSSVTQLTSSDIYPEHLYSLENGSIIFSADGAGYGRELWISDGTTGGTKLLEDINIDSGESSYPENFCKVAEWIYFSANDGLHGKELFHIKDDGTSFGLVKDVSPGISSSYISQILAFNGKVYFEGTYSDLFVSDGTEAGTVKVQDMDGQIKTLFSGSTTLYAMTGYSLYQSDGTEAGTTRVSNNIHLLFLYNSYSTVTEIGTTLYFSAYNNVRDNYELYSYDGSSIIRIKDIDPGDGGSKPYMLTTVGSKLYFVANDKFHGYELYSSDGTEAHTQLVSDIKTRQNESFPHNFVTINKTVYFVASDSIHGEELWKSDGSPEGTVMVKDTIPGSPDGNIKNMYAVGSLLFFTSSSTNYIWRSDGTTSGTYILNSIRVNSYPYPSFTHIGNTLYFPGTTDSTKKSGTDSNGTELYKSDGTIAETVLVKDIRAGASGSYPSNLTTVGNTLFFFADDGSNGIELWKSDGSESGTQIVADINPDGDALNSFRYAKYDSLNGALFFFANDGTHGIELWKSNGSAAGTQMVADINPVGNSNDGDEEATLISLGDAIYFVADNNDTGYELYKSDGTTVSLVKDINPGVDDGINGYQEYNQLTKVGDKLFFMADDGVHGNEVWVSDGTTAGTKMVKDLDAAKDYTSFVAVGKWLYFTADSKLWKTDGTAANTVQISTTIYDYPSENASGAMCHSLFFPGYSLTNGDSIELWISKGEGSCSNGSFLPAVYFLLFN